MTQFSDSAGAGPASVFRYGDALLPNLAALNYATAGWAIGVWWLTSGTLLLAVIGVALVTHALAIGAYLLHDCAHNAVFASKRGNDRLGAVLSWLSGAAISDYPALREKHLRHHADRLDVVSFDYRAVLAAAPAWFRRTILAAEWSYIPAVELLMRALIVRQRWRAGVEARRRLVTVLSVWACALALLGTYSLRALFFYAVAYVLFLHILRFQDAFQHTFDVYTMDDPTPAPRALVRSRAYEHENTYSDVISVGHPLLNLLVLNFAYHNAHHAKPAEPWYRLYRLHRSLYGGDQSQVLPARTLLASYHRHRVARVLSPDYGTVGPADGNAGSAGEARAHDFLGAVGVSFLTAA